MVWRLSVVPAMFLLDLNLPDTENLKIKANLVMEIMHAIRKLGISQEEAGHHMELTQAQITELLRGNFSNVSERKLMACLSRLGYDPAG